jgi:NitT/TauT family transport system substrate-binding protein
MRRRLIGGRTLVVTAMAGALLLAACGSDDDEGGGATTTASSETTAGASTTAGGATTTGGATTSSAPLEPIKVTFLPATESLAVLTQLQALANDYFEEEGIELEYLGVLANAAQAAQTVVTGQADIAGTGSTGVIATASADRDVVAIASISKEPTTILTLSNETIEELAAQGVTPDSPIEERVQALKGLTLGLPTAGSSTDILVRSTLAEYGVNPDSDLTIQPVQDGPSLAAALRVNQVDGIAFSPPDSVVGVADGTAQIWISYPRGDVPAFAGMPLTDIVTSRQYLEENPEAVRRMLKALWRASEDIKNDPEAVRPVVKERFFPDLDQAVYDQSFDAVLPGFQQGLVPTESGLEKLLVTVNAARPDKIELTFDEVYDTTLVEETAP